MNKEMTKELAMEMIDEYLREPEYVDKDWVEALKLCKKAFEDLEVQTAMKEGLINGQETLQRMIIQKDKQIEKLEQERDQAFRTRRIFEEYLVKHKALPCKVGDTVWVIGLEERPGEVVECVVTEIGEIDELYKDEYSRISMEYEPKDHENLPIGITCPIVDIGQLIYFSREEAEAEKDSVTFETHCPQENTEE